MYLWYRGIPAEVLVTNYFGREPIMTEDGIDMLYQHWTVDVIMQVNPRTMSYDPNQQDVRQPPFYYPGIYPVDTDTILRQHFLTPSGRLTILGSKAGAGTSNGKPDVLLDVPVPPYTCDAKGGPFPQKFDIIKVHADKTVTVRFVIEVFLRPEHWFLSNDGHASPILAHRWHQWVDVDEDFLAVRRTTGVAYFDMAELWRQDVVPDQFRQDLPFPIPLGWKRENIHVEAIMDGTAVRYAFEEREWPMSFGPNIAYGVTRCEAYFTEWVYQYIDPLIGAGAEAGGDLGSVVGASGLGKGFGSWVGGILSGFSGGLGSVPDKLRQHLPQFSKHCLVRVWGHRNSTKSDLTKMAMAIAVSSVNPGNANGLATRESSIQWDLMGKFVEYQSTHTMPPGPQTFKNGASFGGDFIGFNDDVASINGKIIQSTPAVLPLPPNSNGTRGTWIGNIFAQALTAPGQIPLPPSNFDNVDADFYPDWAIQSPLVARPFPTSAPAFANPQYNSETDQLLSGDIAYPPTAPAGTPSNSSQFNQYPWDPDPRSGFAGD